ncbi:hypothetical protein FE789_22490 [Burkholderia pseudomallei]|nr:hypothetical protein FE789_22490 [Burkholderia pseudomallei]
MPDLECAGGHAARRSHPVRNDRTNPRPFDDIEKIDIETYKNRTILATAPELTYGPTRSMRPFRCAGRQRRRHSACASTAST